MAMVVVVRGGGDLASGVILRLHRAGLRVAVAELPQPLTVRRMVSFAEAIYAGEITIENVIGRRAPDAGDTLRLMQIFSQNKVPVVADPKGVIIHTLHPTVVVDARMLKYDVPDRSYSAPLVIGLGPGFTAGDNCHAVIETNRGHNMGRVIWKGTAEPDTGIPEAVHEYRNERVLRTPVSGILENQVDICAHVEAGQAIARIDGHVLEAPFTGVLRGLMHTGLEVQEGWKIGDLDPRDDLGLCTLVSDKALAIGGGVLEAILSRPDLRPKLWS